MHDIVKECYVDLVRCPEYIWVTEILRIEDRRVVGEVILDSTDSLSAVGIEQVEGEERPIPYLALHIPGAIWLAAPFEAPDDTVVRPETVGIDHDLYLIPADRDYEPFENNSDTIDPPRSHRNLGPIREAG